MINIQLFLADKEVELNNKVKFPLTKEFEHLFNPTDILVEYSKSINIPASNKNNAIMANAYRLDRKFVINDGNINIGMQLDPLKRIPMKLIHNGAVLLDGYAKYASSTINDKQTYYTFNLYGSLGDVFQTLMDCVVDENKLTDEQKSEEDAGQKYVIKEFWETPIIDRTFVKESWEHPDINFNEITNPHNCVGMSPAYRGLYENFESTSAYGLTWYTAFDGDRPTEVQSVEDQLKQVWKKNLMNNGKTEETATARIDALDYNIIVPNGLSEHQIGQFRSYEQKPYIYMHALMRLFQNKCTELTGYKINLDSTWFNPNNPYYANMCYMLDYLSAKGKTQQPVGMQFNSATKSIFSAVNTIVNKSSTFTSSRTVKITDTSILTRGNIVLEPADFGVEIKYDKFTLYDPTKCKISMNPNVELLVDVAIKSNNTTTHSYYWGSTGIIGVTGEAVSPDERYYTNNNFAQLTETTSYDSATNKLIGKSILTVPKIIIPHVANNDLEITYNVSLFCHHNNSNKPVLGRLYFANTERQEIIAETYSTDLQAIFPEVKYESNWRNSTTCSLKNLYTKDEPLFSVILQYTKMMGLIWKADYKNKTIDILTKRSYFRNPNVVNWTNKVDKSKGMTIEPVSFNSKYIVFNYESVEGNNYSGYKTKYGVNYGEKKIRTKYSFDIKEENLYDNKIYPSSVSTKQFATINNLRNWNTLTPLPVTSSEIDFIDCENEDMTSAISLNNWYFRGQNVDTDNVYWISDVSPMEIRDNKYYWVGLGTLQDYNIADFTYILPTFSPVYKSNVDGAVYGCLFNCPNEDYTKNGQISSASGHYIYDICWDNYINERYNANNKKLTCYVRLTANEFEKFNFKTFVIIDNQLFVVNKIIDFDVNNSTTKIELIQVTNIYGYIDQKVTFPEVIFNASELHLKTEVDEYGYYSSGRLSIKCFPLVLDNPENEFRITYKSRGSSNSVLFVEEAENEGNTTHFDITYQSDGNYTEEWVFKLLYNGKTYNIPIYIN